jgi:hypothetical protein
MNIDEIWQQIKNDKGLIYGQPILDIFLALTKTLDSKHFEELTPQQKQKIGEEAALDVLILSLINDNSGESFKQKVQEMGKEVINKLSGDKIAYILDNMMVYVHDLKIADVLGDNLKKLNYEAPSYGWQKGLRQLFLSATNKYNNKNSTKLLEQLFNILQSHQLLDNKLKQNLSYFFASKEFSDEEMEVAIKFLSDDTTGD